LSKKLNSEKSSSASFPYNLDQHPLLPSPFETPTNYKFRFFRELCEKERIEPSLLRVASGDPPRRGQRRGWLINDIHKHYTAKALQKNFTDTERLLYDGNYILYTNTCP
jgi:hypothetical protein